LAGSRVVRVVRGREEGAGIGPRRDSLGRVWYLPVDTEVSHLIIPRVELQRNPLVHI
jgi:hypothetical protein